MSLRRLGNIVFLSFCLMALTVVGLPDLAQGVDVDPGRPDSFEVEAPRSVQAGVEFEVTIRVLDAEGNVVQGYDELDRVIDLSATGEGSLSQAVVNSGDFSNGTLTLRQTYNRSESITIEAGERNYVASGRTSNIRVRPGPPASFTIETPDTARAGEPFSVGLTVRDRFGNRVENYRETTNGVLLRTSGVDDVQPTFLSVDEFNDGRLRTRLRYTVAEEVTLTVVDEVNQIQTTSDSMSVQPGSLHEFTVSTPGSATAGTPFQVAVEAKDRFGNIVTNYPEKGQGVDVKVRGGGDISPRYLPPEEFSGGVVFTELTYNRAGPLRIRVQDRGSSLEGISGRVEVSAGEPAQFNVDVPDEVEAGQDFDVRVEALDSYGNRVRDYSSRGNPVLLFPRGDEATGERVSPGQFDSGQATVTMRRTKAGNVRIEALDVNNDSVSGQSEQVVVVPSSPGQLSVLTPESVTAGEEFSVTIRLEDRFGNQIRNTGSLAGDVHTSILDHGSGIEQSFAASQFIEGEKELVFRHEMAEDVEIFAEYREHDIRSRSSTVSVTPAEFDHFAIRTPGRVVAGQSFTIGGQLRDRYGNTLQSVPEEMTDIELRSTGSDNLTPSTVDVADLSAPSFTVSARYVVAESMSIQMVDGNGREIGTSPPIRVAPAELASFQIETPRDVRTTEPFPVRLKALDAYNNTIRNLNERNGEVVIASDGAGDVQPNVLSYNRFVNGVAEETLEYHRAEDIQLQVRGNGTESQSSTISVQPGPPSQFEVATQNRVRAGVPFPAVIEVFDEHDNRVTSLPDDFHGVRLDANGSRQISPRHLSSTLFNEGRAEVYLAYPESGRVSVSAGNLEQAISTPMVDRYFIERDQNNARIHLLSSHRVPAQLKASPESGRLQVRVQPAELSTRRPERTFDRWFVKKVTQRQTRFDRLPSVELSVFPSERVQTETNFNMNLFTLELSATSNSNGPTLGEVRSLIDSGDYDEASELLNEYLEENPDDERATQLQLRLERVEELMNP